VFASIYSEDEKMQMKVMFVSMDLEKKNYKDEFGKVG